jgi:CubicO group peptidase (beta-lactamase class C family)
LRKDRVIKTFKVFPLFALLVLRIGLVANDQTAVLAARPSQEEPPLRLSEPTEAIVADLESYIPGYMREQGIPGVGIALIRDGEVVWTEGFGVANAIARQPVTPETAFEVASTSKVMTAYTALRLVDQGNLSLDEPLNVYLPEPLELPQNSGDRVKTV